MASRNDVVVRLRTAGARQSRDDLGSVEKAMRGLERTGGRIGGALTGFGKVGIAAIGGVAVAAGGLIGTAAALGISTASSMQQAQISFETMLGSAEKAGAFLTELKSFAATTPFEFPELQSASSSLISAGFEAGQVIPIMRTLGDVTSGMGTGSEGIQRATIALQQMQAAGKISGEDLAQLRDAGIPVYDLLAAATGKAKDEVVALAQKGKLGRKELEQMVGALESGKGLERFSGLMEKQSKSLVGVWSTLKDNVGMALSDAVQPAVPALTSLIDRLGVMAGTYLPMASAKLTELGGAGRQVWGVFRSFGAASAVSTLDAMTGSGGRLSSAFAVAQDVIGDVRALIVNSLVPAVVQVSQAITPGWLTPIGLARAGLGVLADHTTLLRTALLVLLPAMLAWRVYLLAGAAATGIATAMTKAKAAADFIATARTYGLSYAVAAGGLAEKALTAGRAVGTAVTGAWTAATNLATAANIRGRIAAVGARVATIAQSVATKAAAAGQWLLNAALTANPIGLVVAAVALLVAGFVIAYKKSETFRGFVDGLWAALKKLIGFSPFGLLIRHFDTILDKIKAVGRAIADSPVGKAVGAVFSAFSAFGGGKATGGPVAAGTTYLVGEQGPELFTPGRSGGITPTDVTSAVLNGPRDTAGGLGLLRPEEGGYVDMRPIHAEAHFHGYNGSRDDARRILTLLDQELSDTLASR